MQSLAKVVPTSGKDDTVQAHARKGWAVAKTAVKVGTFEKMRQHKKKIAAAVALKITILVVELVIVLGAGAAFLAVKSGKACKLTGKFCKAEPKPDPKAAEALSFGTQSVIPPKGESRRRRERVLKDIHARDLQHVLRGNALFGRKLAIDPNAFADTSDYKMKKTSYYVSEESAEALNFVNLIFCDVAQLRADMFVNQGPYKAMVDEGKCTNDGSKVDWTVDVTTVGEIDTCVSDTIKEAPECGYIVKVWFDGGGVSVEAILEVWKPPANADVPKLKLRFSAGAVQFGQLVKVVSGTTVDLDFGTWMKHPQLNGGQQFQKDQIHAVFDTVTKAGKATSSALSMMTGTMDSFKLTFNKDFAQKKKNTDPEMCLDLRTPKNVGSRYELYDETGKAKVFQEGFPVEATVSGQAAVCEAWVGFHGLHVHNTDCNAGFTDGKTVNKINYDAESSRTPYTLKMTHGKLWKFTKKSIQLGQIKGMPLKLGHGGNAKLISWNGTDLVEIGRMSGSCFPVDNQHRPSPKNGKTSRKECMCDGATSGNWWEKQGFWWKEDVVRVEPAIPFVIDAKKYPWGLQVQAGEGISAFHGDMDMNVEEVATLYFDGSKTFAAGNTVTQGTATGTVKESSAAKFTAFASCSNCITIDDVTPAEYNYVCGSSGDTVTSSSSGESVYEGAVLTQAVTGATGVVVGYGHVGWQVAFKVTSGTFDATNTITVSTPSEKVGQWVWTRISGTFTPTAMSTGQNSVKVIVTSGAFQRATYSNSAWAGDNLFVNGTDFGKPHWVQNDKGDIIAQPSASTTISYTVRELVMPGDAVPELLCYDRCPKGSVINTNSCTDDSSCTYASPSILSDERVDRDGGGGCTGTPTFTFANIGGSPAMTGTMANGRLAAVQLTNKGHTCTNNPSPTVTVSGLTNCNDGLPKVEVSCREQTDDSSSFGQAHVFTYNGISGTLKDGSNSLAKPYVPNAQNVHLSSGALFENSAANKNALKCEHNTNEVCYHEVRRELSTFYEWETGSQYSQRASLVDNNNVAVKFDQPESVSYTHSGSVSNSGINYDGSMILLTYDGELQGFPSFCMDKSTGEPGDCDPWSRQTPDIAVPEGALFTSTKDGKEYVAKAGEIEEIMKLAASNSSCSGSAFDFTNMPVAMSASAFKTFTNGKAPDLAEVSPLVFSGVLLADLEKRAADEASAARL